ncbi:stability protein StbD [Aggregatibacter actinomycetemcomitans]|uniref:type II toxin-antitoxin system Phd/YefM family antitoxin n=1 Tax=Aggregatibacter actinomycetemcomitans TaxID=714 RepID=UPI00022AC079|nr:stability protein StbD [Aggregatibacter actinomycetemcomitans]KOE70044.1 stability protein StbD [Aggregatibacter actinomycetemcomitans serotype f str. D18P1]KYK88067.1 stability protein StbD [Aggregatibacter actinomycetemcomitans serotype f str. SC29R]MBN6061487.1 stability protein StbD [Aggregatibacter actinomycetemcomitans]OZV16918.1 stability protein StbD [Aggregatibacter actinomycetemcomitans]UEL52665.1 stability protein StbD [Aggregatibacter actinomycetemcomitans]
MAIHQILTQQAASITDLKRDPMGIAYASQDGAVAILNRNQPAFYCVTPALFEYFQNLVEDAELGRIAEERLATLDPIEVSIDDL